MKYTVSYIRGRTCIKVLRTGAEENTSMATGSK
jgi:hypothetical protein